MGAAKRQRLIPASFPGPTYIEVGHAERIGRSRSKLIFFLTIDNSHALNGPVATHVQLVNRMASIASGSTRLLPLLASHVSCAIPERRVVFGDPSGH